MKHEGCSHILYEWENYVEVKIAGETRRYNDGYRSLIMHRLEDIAKSCPQIPTTALKTPVWYSSYNETWFLANGQRLQLPHKL